MDVIHALGRSYRLRAWFEAPANGSDLAPFASSILATLCRDFHAAMTLRRALERLEPLTNAVDEWELRRLVERAIDDGRLVLEEIVEAPLRFAPVASRDTEPPTPVEPVEDDWIEIELIDLEGNPVPHQRFELVLPDGRRRTGSLNDNGWARVEGVPSGRCKVSFPYWDAQSWRAA